MGRDWIVADVVPAEVDVGMTTASEVRVLVRDDVHPSVRLCARATRSLGRRSGAGAEPGQGQRADDLDPAAALVEQRPFR